MRIQRGTFVLAGAMAAALVAAIPWLRSGERWAAGAMAGGNVLLVTIDTLRADRLTDTGMPALSARTRHGHSFKAAYTHAPLTLPAHASLLSGLLPPAHGVHGNGGFRLAEATTTLAERLQSAGYRTGAFVAAFVLDARFGLAQGFEVYDGVADDRPFAADFAYAERRAPAVLAAAHEWLTRRDSPERPWFAWIHLFDPHGPYNAPDQPPGYEGEVRFVDEAIDRFLRRLEDSGLLRRTLVVVTADHGESLGEHGESTHGLFAYDATMRVPLVVIGPGLLAGEHDERVAHVDVVPTILDTLGLPVPDGLPGRSLRAARRDPLPIYLEAHDGWLSAGAAPLTAVVDGDLKYVELPRPELYDLASDPRETANLLPAAEARARPLARRLRELAAQTGTAVPVAIDTEATARLRSLGYAAGGSRPPAAPFTHDDDPKAVLPLYERFLAELSSGRPRSAELRSIIAERPAFDAARLVAGSALIADGRAAEAAALLAAAPVPSLAVRERLGAAYIAAGRADEAVRALADVVADPSASADAWNALGTAHAQGGHHREALAAFERAVALAPGSGQMRLNRALAHLGAGNPSAARSDAAAATIAQPALLDAWRLKGTLDHGAGDLDGAIAAWRQVVARDPDDLDTLFNVAVTLRDLGRTEEARTFARRFADAVRPGAHQRDLAVLAPLLARR